MLFHACAVQKPILSFGCLAQQGTGVIFVQTVHCSFLDKIQTEHRQTQFCKEESLFFVKQMMVVPLSTAGVSDGDAQELQMPTGPQMLEDVDEPMLARSATLRDPGTPESNHFPSQPWCKMCVESRRRDSPHREQSKIDAVVRQLQFDCGYMGFGGPLQIACFLVGTDTSIGARRWCRTPTQKEFFSCHWTRWQKNVVLKDKTGEFYDKYHRHRAIRAMEESRLHSAWTRENISGSSPRQNPCPLK